MLAKTLLWQAPFLVSFAAGPNAALLTLPDVTLFIADTDYELLYAQEVHEVLGTDGSAVTADIKKCTTTQAASAGTTMLSSTFNLKSTINTVQTKTPQSGLTTTLANRRVAVGNRIALDFGGTMTAVAGVCVQLWLRRLRRPKF